MKLFCAFCLCWLTLSDEDKVNQYIDRNIDNSRIALNAKQYIVPIVEASIKYNVDALLIATTAMHESAFNPNAVSKDGKDIGIMQLRYGAATKGCKKIKVPRNNIFCGTRWLRVGFAKCGSWLGSINHYMTGKCSPLHWRAKRRFAKWKKI